MNALIKVAALAALSTSTAAFAAESGAFSKLDTNGDGKISMDEAKADPDISAKFAELDTDKNGSLTSSEMKAGAKRPRER
jgi:Ca2+-binding EF-hand superfamily protein